jgi:membrane glycosyltransferase
MAGAIVFVIVMVLVVPVGIMFGGAIWSALFGWLSTEDAQRRADEPADPQAEAAA